MAQAGTIKTITGNVNARTPDGQVRQLMAGDMVYENETIETAAGSELAIELNDGRTLNLAENSQVVIDETVVEAVAPQDAVVAEVRELQAALEAGEEIPDEETAAGEEDAGHNYDLAYYAGDQSGGQVDSYLFGTGYGDEDEDFPDIEGEEEPEAAVVPAPEPEPTPVFIVGSPDDDDGTLGTDYHTVNPGGDVQGEILGQDGADVLAGDPGSVTPVSNNYILILDYSGSITDGDPDLDENVSLDEDFSSLINKTVETIEKLGSNVQDSADGYEVKINLLPFAGNADGINSAWISFTNQDGTVNIEYNLGGNTGTGTIDDIDAIIGEISGWMTSTAFSLIGDVDDTNYYAAFEQAQYLVDTDYDQNGVIFISDGAVNAGGAYMGTDASPYDVLKEMVDSIQAIGITITESDRTAETINNIAEDAPVYIGSDWDLLSDEMFDLMTPQEDYKLDPAGNDEIYGNDGNDIIFGDVLNTDGVFDDIADDYDLSGITELPDGSGWQVFETLENELAGWTRADTIQYIRDHHEDLAEETVLGAGPDDGDVRDGGNDDLYGGAGDDIIYGQEGDDTIDTGPGDDVVDGGSGFDTLVVTSETELDFSNVSNIERIDLNGDNVDQTITLSLDQVLNMTDENNTLQITGEDGDSVTLTGVADGGWTHDGNGLFTNVADNSIQVTFDTVDDGVNIDVDVDNGDSFQI